MNFDAIEPHLNSEAYRNHHPLNIIDKQINFIESSPDYNFLVGCSSLTGRYWYGSLYYCQEVDGAPDNAITSIKLETGLTDGKFIGDKKVIVAEDSGVVRVLALQAKEEYASNKQRSMSLTCISSSCEHDGTVLSLSVFPDLTHAVTGGDDKNIKVFDIETLVAEHTYRPAHRSAVTCVCTRPQDANGAVFASCSLDGRAVLWDTRKPRPAAVLVGASDGLTALAWHPTRPDTLAVGSENGSVSLVDVRQGDPVSHFEPFDRPVNRLRFADHCNNLLAVCANDTSVKVFDCTPGTSKIIYTDDRHLDFVKGLAWHPSSHKLLSCGWDRQILTHDCASVTNEV